MNPYYIYTRIDPAPPRKYTTGTANPFPMDIFGNLLLGYLILMVLAPYFTLHP